MVSKDVDPWDIPEWQALAREAFLTRQIIGSGVTALGRADYADKKGEYYVAFFGISVGVERLAKLIFVADYSIKNAGHLPSGDTIKKFGHNLQELIEICDKISKCHSLTLKYERPINPISTSIFRCLNDFANASKGRYANFQALGDPSFGEEFEPIRRYWKEVAEPILCAHFVGTKKAKDVERNAQIAEKLMGDFTHVLHIDETGSRMGDVYTASLRSGQTPFVQKYGRYYTMLIVRWLAEIFEELSRKACTQHDIDAFFGKWEYFWTYTVDDYFLKNRKIWPLT